MYTLLDINSTFFTLLNYPLSYIEFFGTLFGLLTVILAVRANILTWPTGIINELFFFILFFQVQLYANMILQIIFFMTTLYGWYNWSKHKTDNNPLPITSLPTKYLIYISLLILIASYLLAILIDKLPQILPQYFTKPAAFPLMDAAVMIISIVATLLLAQKVLQNWLLWIINNILCIILYIQQGIYFIAIEYVIFLVTATLGFYQWHKASHPLITQP